MAQFTAALRLKPDYAGAHWNLGATLVEEDRVSEAIGQYTEALRLEPDYPEANQNLDQALVQFSQQRSLRFP